LKLQITIDGRVYEVDVEVLEDGKPQKIALFEGGRFYPRTVPLEIALLFYCSGSVQFAGTLDPHVFDENLLKEHENVALAIYAFSDNLVRLTGPTRDGPALRKAMDAVRAVPAGDTPLFGDIAETARDAASIGGNATRMMVIFSDGQADYDDIGGYGGAVDAAKRLGISLYPVLLPSAEAPGSFGDRLSESMEKFQELGSRSGGESFADVMMRVHPETVKVLKGNNARWLTEFEELIGKNLLLKSDPTLHPEQFDIQG